MRISGDVPANTRLSAVSNTYTAQWLSIHRLTYVTCPVNIMSLVASTDLMGSSAEVQPSPPILIKITYPNKIFVTTPKKTLLLIYIS
jgi:hypothetical protein